MAQINTLNTADGATIRYGIWNGRKRPDRGNVLLLNGRREFIEKYTETIADLNRRGCTVVSFDWRGQGLSTRLLPDRLKGHIEHYNQYINDLNAIVQQVGPLVADGPWILLAHSMGAHIALRYMNAYPKQIHKAVFTSPMIDIRLSPYPTWLARSLVSLAMKIGRAGAIAPGGRTHSSNPLPFEDNRLTSDPIRYRIDQQAIAKNPDLALGGPTYGWLAATFASIKVLTQDGFTDRISPPLLMVLAADDRIVCNRSAGRICARMPGCRIATIKDARHEILMETDAVRNQFWALFDEHMD